MRVLLMISNSNMSVRELYGMVLRDRHPGWGISNMSGLPISPATIMKGFDVVVYELGAADDPQRYKAVRALWEVFPQTKATGKDEATALKDDVKVLEARAHAWRLESGGVAKWGENSEANYAAYIDFLVKWGVLKQKVEASDIITNELIDDINKFDPAEIAALAKKQAGN